MYNCGTTRCYAASALLYMYTRRLHTVVSQHPHHICICTYIHAHILMYLCTYMCKFICVFCPRACKIPKKKKKKKQFSFAYTTTVYLCFIFFFTIVYDFCECSSIFLCLLIQIIIQSIC